MGNTVGNACLSCQSGGTALPTTRGPDAAVSALSALATLGAGGGGVG